MLEPLAHTESYSPGFTCVKCGLQLWIPIADLRATSLGLNDDARFPGRCILVLSSHADHLEELSKKLSRDFFRDIQHAGSAIKNAMSADRMNYAILGNRESHLHVHLIPRVFKGDPIPTSAPWEHPDPITPLTPRHRDEVIQAIQRSLGTDSAQ